jgi:hypothetical protein
MAATAELKRWTTVARSDLLKRGRWLTLEEHKVCVRACVRARLVLRPRAALRAV